MAIVPAQRRFASRQDYETPDEFLNAVKRRFSIDRFTVDLAADDGNYVVKPFFTIDDNSLIQDWVHATAGGWGWLNPPFGKIGPWAEKAKVESSKGAKLFMLVPAAVGANWWRDHVHNYSQVYFLNGRISFDGENPYPKDCALLLYYPCPAHPLYNIWTWKDHA